VSPASRQSPSPVTPRIKSDGIPHELVTPSRRPRPLSTCPEHSRVGTFRWDDELGEDDESTTRRRTAPSAGEVDGKLVLLLFLKKSFFLKGDFSTAFFFSKNFFFWVTAALLLLPRTTNGRATGTGRHRGRQRALHR